MVERGSHRWSTGAVALSLLVAACGSPAAPADGLADEDMEVLAVFFETHTSGLVGEYVLTTGPLPVSSVSSDFVRSHACNAGGTVEISGSVTLSNDGTFGSVDIESSGLSERVGCALSSSRGTTTVDGSGFWSYERHGNRIFGPLTSTTTLSGDFHWSRGADEGDCSYDLTGTLEYFPSAYELVGAFCGRTIAVIIRDDG